MEGIPNALLESMSCGLACCFVKMKGIENFLNNNGENSLLFHNIEGDKI